MNFDEAVKKIVSKAKSLKFFAQKDFSESGKALFVCGQEIATHPNFPNFVFVIDSNMIYKGNELTDSSYTVYNFDMEGNYVEKLEMKDLPSDFMSGRVTYMKID